MEQRDMRADAVTTPATEKIDIGGRRLALTRAGHGVPTVILETGLGAESSEWAPIRDALAWDATILSYDRANRGESDPAPGARSAGEMIDDLDRLLRAAGLPPPYVIVGHSFGGLLARLFTARRPKDVAGVVLVDSFHEDQFDVFGPMFPPPSLSDSPELRGVRFFWQDGWRSPDSTQEHIDFAASIAEGRRVTSLGNVPLAILVAGTYRNQPALPPEARAWWQRRWEAMQAGFVALSTCATQRLVLESGHFVQRDAPRAVIEAVRSVLVDAHLSTSHERSVQ